MTEYEAWFHALEAEMSRIDPRDQYAATIDLSRPADRARIVRPDPGAESRVSPCLPPEGPITPEKIQELYALAAEGNLFVYPLGEMIPLQVRTEGDSLLRPLKATLGTKMLKNHAPKPELQELSFLKKIFNLFGFFEEEKQAYEAEYRAACQRYQLDVNAQACCKLADDNHFCKWREQAITTTWENFRKDAPQMIPSIHRLLDDPNTPEWKKPAYRARVRLLEGLLENKMEYTQEEVHNMLTDATMESLLSRKSTLAQRIGSDPQQLEALREAIHHSPGIQSALQENIRTNNKMVAACVFGSNNADTLTGNFSRDQKEWQIAADMLVKENQLPPYEKNLENLKALFCNKQVEARVNQLYRARAAIPTSQLTIPRHMVPLDSPEVLELYQAQQAQAQPKQPDAPGKTGPFAGV